MPIRSGSGVLQFVWELSDIARLRQNAEIALFLIIGFVAYDNRFCCMRRWPCVVRNSAWWLSDPERGGICTSSTPVRGSAIAIEPSDLLCVAHLSSQAGRLHGCMNLMSPER